jgi:hypothetical protein
MTNQKHCFSIMLSGQKWPIRSIVSQLCCQAKNYQLEALFLNSAVRPKMTNQKHCISTLLSGQKWPIRSIVSQLCCQAKIFFFCLSYRIYLSQFFSVIIYFCLKKRLPSQKWFHHILYNGKHSHWRGKNVRPSSCFLGKKLHPILLTTPPYSKVLLLCFLISGSKGIIMADIPHCGLPLLAL